MLSDYGIEYKGVSCGKLRRYFSWENIKDAFKIPIGIIQAFFILRKFKANIIFSKGGFVSIPTVIAGFLLRIPTICHESDLKPGLANKICFTFSNKICLSFEESEQFVKQKNKLVITGTPIRKLIFSGDKEKAIEFTKLKGEKPILLVIGGSQGAMQINKLIDNNLNYLLEYFEIIHLRGPGNIEKSIHEDGYIAYDYLNNELADIYDLSDIVVSRGGANSLAELAALNKKVLIIPLGLSVSRGDQIDNAKIYSKKFNWKVLKDNFSDEDFVNSLNSMIKGENPNNVIKNGSKEIVSLIFKTAKV